MVVTEGRCPTAQRVTCASVRHPMRVACAYSWWSSAWLAPGRQSSRWWRHPLVLDPKGAKRARQLCVTCIPDMPLLRWSPPSTTGQATTTGRGRGPGESRKGGRGSGTPKVCVPQMARSHFPNGKFRFLAQWSLWSGAGGGFGMTPGCCAVCSGRRLSASRHLPSPFP